MKAFRFLFFLYLFSFSILILYTIYAQKTVDNSYLNSNLICYSRAVAGSGSVPRPAPIPGPLRPVWAQRTLLWPKYFNPLSHKIFCILCDFVTMLGTDTAATPVNFMIKDESVVSETESHASCSLSMTSLDSEIPAQNQWIMDLSHLLCNQASIVGCWVHKSQNYEENCHSFFPRMPLSILQWWNAIGPEFGLYISYIHLETFLHNNNFKLFSVVLW